jgi:nicotinate-nucleotide adenylyltransferase
MSNTMRLGYFGGSFDPPHLGHLAVAGAAARAFKLERVLFVPTGRQPLKPEGADASFADRLAMTQLLCESQPAANFEVSLLDAPLAGGEANYTVDALERLHRESPADDIFVLVGADAFLDLRRWRDPHRLIELAEWIVVSRPGFALGQIGALGLSAEQRRRIHALEGVAEDASASRIREELRADSDCSGLLPPAVLAYIRSHHLYDT